MDVFNLILLAATNSTGSEDPVPTWIFIVIGLIILAILIVIIIVILFGNRPKDDDEENGNSFDIMEMCDDAFVNIKCPSFKISKVMSKSIPFSHTCKMKIIEVEQDEDGMSVTFGSGIPDENYSIDVEGEDESVVAGFDEEKDAEVVLGKRFHVGNWYRVTISSRFENVPNQIRKKLEKGEIVTDQTAGKSTIHQLMKVRRVTQQSDGVTIQLKSSKGDGISIGCSDMDDVEKRFGKRPNVGNEFMVLTDVSFKKIEKPKKKG